jgi:hypothetical protein
VTIGELCGGTTITTSNAASNESRSSEKGEEMPQELLSRRWQCEISDPVVVREMRLNKTQKTRYKRIAFLGGKLRSEGQVLTIEIKPEVHMDE